MSLHSYFNQISILQHLDSTFNTHKIVINLTIGHFNRSIVLGHMMTLVEEEEEESIDLNHNSTEEDEVS